MTMSSQHPAGTSSGFMSDVRDGAPGHTVMAALLATDHGSVHIPSVPGCDRMRDPTNEDWMSELV